MKPENYPTSHQIARKILDLPDAIAILKCSIFDSPGESTAIPVDVQAVQIEGRNCIAFIPLTEQAATATA